MKKFFACVFIMILVALYCFFAGWTQIRVPADSTGIVISRLKGTSSNLVEKGKFTFHKEFIIPKNAQIIKFTSKPFTKEITVEGKLPSGDIYSENSSYNFDYSFTFDIELHTAPENLLNLYKYNIITDQDSYENYLKTTAGSIAQEAAGYYLERKKQDSDFIPETVTIIDLYKKLKFNEKYPEVQIDAITLKKSNIPDFELYRYAKNLVLARISAQD